MNLSNLFNLTNIEMGLVLIGVSLLLSLSINLICLRQILHHRGSEKRSRMDADRLKRWLIESETICQGLSHNLEEKREIADQLVRKLEKKIEHLDLMIKKIEDELSSLSERKMEGDLIPRIIEMAKAGCQISEIARDLNLSKGEVQLALDLEKYRQ